MLLDAESMGPALQSTSEAKSQLLPMLASVMKAGQALSVNSIHVMTWVRLALEMVHVLLPATPVQSVFVIPDSLVMTVNRVVMINALETIPTAVPRILMALKDMAAMEAEVAIIFARGRVILLVDSARTSR